MTNLFTVTISDTAADLLVTYGAGALIRVQSSATQAGTYADVVTVPIVTGHEVYAVYDELGVSTDWYQIRYEAADGDPAGAYSTPFQPMPLDGTYASLGDFKVFTRGLSADTSDDAIMLLALDAAARAIDRACGRTFALTAATATARTYTATRMPVPSDLGYSPYITPYHYMVEVDDFFDTSELAVAFDTTSNGDYDLAVTAFRPMPTNAPARSMPYTRLLFDTGTYAPLTFEGVQVTTKWGWSAVPNTIQTANLLQAARFLKRRDAPFGIAGSAEIGSEMRLMAKVDPDVAVMVSAYRRNWGAV